MKICLSPGRETENLFGVALYKHAAADLVACSEYANRLQLYCKN